MRKVLDSIRLLPKRAGERVHIFFTDMKELLDKQPVSFAVLCGYVLSVILILYYILAFILAFTWLDDRVFPLSPFFSLLVILFSFTLFPISTLYEELNFNTHKNALFLINYTLVCLNILSMVFHYTGVFIFRSVFRLKITPFVTPSLLIGWARWLETLICGGLAAGMVSLVAAMFKNKDVMQELYFFRLTQYVDLRPNKTYLYDLHLGRDITNKKPIVVFEKDRYLHMTDNGVSGSGKSALVLINGICEDMDTKLRNERIQKKKIREMLREGKVYRAVESDRFNVYDFKPYPVAEKEYEKMICTYRSAGQTIMAPDASMLDKVYMLAKVRGIKCNRIDPTILPNGRFKEGFTGFNPFYVPPEVSAEQDIHFVIMVNDRASIYRDVMQQLYELNGNGSDSYFTGLNMTANYNMSLLCILTYPFLEGRQANPLDCLRELNDMNPNTVSYTEEVQDKNGNIRRVKKEKLVPSPSLLRLLDCYSKHFSETVHENFDDTFYGYFVKLFVNELGQGVEIYNRSLGLRNLISGFVLNPHIRPIITVPDDNTLVISRALERGEITLFNFYQEMGTSVARVFGLFFILNYDVAVKGRPGTEDNRNPNFFRLDELPVLLHPIMNSQISLYRKYRVPCEYAFQSLAQMGETPQTKFLSAIMMSCGTQVLFGRANLEEMEHYSKLAGIYKENVEQVSYNEGSAWLEGGITQSIRSTPTDTAYLSEDDIRYRNFRECSVFFTREGVSRRPVISRMDFLPESAYEDKMTEEDYFPLDDYPVMDTEGRTPESPIYTREVSSISLTEVRTGSTVAPASMVGDVNGMPVESTQPPDLPEEEPAAQPPEPKKQRFQFPFQEIPSADFRFSEPAPGMEPAASDAPYAAPVQTDTEESVDMGVFGMAAGMTRHAGKQKEQE